MRVYKDGMVLMKDTGSLTNALMENKPQEIKIQEETPDSIIAEYLINGKLRVYVYNLSDLNDCEHYFDDEDKLVRTLVKRDKGMSEEDYYSEMPIPDVTKMVLAAERKLRQTT